jgi:hypothetical protein
MQATRVWVEGELLERVAAELENTNYRAIPFNPAEPPGRGVVIVRHAQPADELAKARVKLAVLAVIDAEELDYPHCAIADFVMSDWRRGELRGRLARLTALEEPGYRVHLLARAVEYSGDII